MGQFRLPLSSQLNKRPFRRPNLDMKLLFIMSVGAMFLVLTRPVKGAKLGSIESPVETLTPLETREVGPIFHADSCGPCKMCWLCFSCKLPIKECQFCPVCRGRKSKCTKCCDENDNNICIGQ